VLIENRNFPQLHLITHPFLHSMENDIRYYWVFAKDAVGNITGVKPGF
jgi:hypothetical protein